MSRRRVRLSRKLQLFPNLVRVKTEDGRLLLYIEGEQPATAEVLTTAQAVITPAKPQR